MNAHPDLQSRLDRAIGDGPPPPPLDDLLSTGRRVVRRRRARLGSALAGAAACVVVLVPLVVGPDQPTGVDGPTPFPASQPPPPGSTAGFSFDLQAQYDADGTLRVRPGASVTTTVQDPAGTAFPEQSAALVTEWRGSTYWTYAYFTGGRDLRSGVTSIRPEEAHGDTFDQWLTNEAALTPGTGEDPSYLTLSASGTAAPVGEAVILEQTSALPTVLVPDGYVGVAAVVAVGPARLCVLARTKDGNAEYLAQNASQAGPGLAGCISSLDGWAPDES